MTCESLTCRGRIERPGSVKFQPKADLFSHWKENPPEYKVKHQRPLVDAKRFLRQKAGRSSSHIPFLQQRCHHVGLVIRSVQLRDEIIRMQVYYYAVDPRKRSILGVYGIILQVPGMVVVCFLFYFLFMR